jgi:hypothetical protein
VAGVSLSCVYAPAQVAPHGPSRKGTPATDFEAIMGFAQSRAALKVAAPPIIKHVLSVLAFHACEDCGLAWPGVKLLALETGLAERTVRDTLVTLRSMPALVTVVSYAQGGRGRTTEYVVIPSVARLSTSDCGKCAKRCAVQQGLTSSGRLKGAPQRKETLRTTAYQPSIEHRTISDEPASGPAASGPNGPEVEPRNSPRPRSDNPEDGQAPRATQSAAEACAEAIRVLTHGRPAMPGTGRNRKPEATP